MNYMPINSKGLNCDAAETSKEKDPVTTRSVLSQSPSASVDQDSKTADGEAGVRNGNRRRVGTQVRSRRSR